MDRYAIVLDRGSRFARWIVRSDDHGVVAGASEMFENSKHRIRDAVHVG